MAQEDGRLGRLILAGIARSQKRLRANVEGSISNSQVQQSFILDHMHIACVSLAISSIHPPAPCWMLAKADEISFDCTQR